MRAFFMLQLFLLCLALSTVSAQEEETPKSEPTKGLSVADLAKRLELKLESAELPEFTVIGVAPEDRLKQLGEVSSKAAEMAGKVLKLEKDDKPFAVKVRLFLLPSKSAFISFVRTVEQRRADNSESSSIDLRRDPPHIAIIVENPKLQVAETDLADTVVAAVLRAKSTPATVPNWFKQGFVKYVQLKSNPKIAAVERPAQKRLVLNRTKRMSDAWDAKDPKEQVLLAASLVEYLAAGPDADKFSKVLGGFRPGEDDETPSFEDAIKNAGLTWEKLEYSWKTWASKQR